MGTGDKRALEAASQAVSSPLLETSVEGARSILLSITGGVRPVAVGGQRGGQDRPGGRAPRREHHLRRDGRREAGRGRGVDHRRRHRVRRRQAAAPTSRCASRPASRASRRTREREPARAGRSSGGGAHATSTSPSSSLGSDGCVEGRRRRRPSAHRGGGGGCAARRRRRGGRRAGRDDAHGFVCRAAADRPGRRRLHARLPARRGGRAAGLLRRGAGPRARAHGPRAARAVDVSFGDASQLFHVGAASVGAYGMPAGICEAHRALRHAAAARARGARGAAAARRRRRQRARRPTCSRSSTASSASRGEARADVRRAERRGSTTASPSSPTRSSASPAKGADPFYTGDIAEAVCRAVARGGGMLTPRDLRAYEVIAREPVRAAYRGREIITNPPPSAGGILIAATLEQLDAGRVDGGRARARPAPAHARRSSSSSVPPRTSR